MESPNISLLTNQYTKLHLLRGLLIQILLSGMQLWYPSKRALRSSELLQKRVTTWISQAPSTKTISCALEDFLYLSTERCMIFFYSVKSFKESTTFHGENILASTKTSILPEQILNKKKCL